MLPTMRRRMYGFGLSVTCVIVYVGPSLPTAASAWSRIEIMSLVVFSLLAVVKSQAMMRSSVFTPFFCSVARMSL